MGGVRAGFWHLDMIWTGLMDGIRRDGYRAMKEERPSIFFATIRAPL
jgi:hypothetical protein